jgi:hypothetical protein
MSKSAPLVKGDGRNPKTGRFLKGNPGGPGGNPNQHRVLRLKRALLDAVSPAQVAKVIRKMGAMGAKGDVAAAKVYLEHAVGKPEHGYDPRQVMPADGAEKRAVYQPTPEEKRVLAQVLLAEADAEEGVIETDGEEVQGE